MHDEKHCRGCGNVLPNGALNGLCPVCLLQEGLAGDGSADDTGPVMCGTREPAGALATLDKSIGGLPRVLLRDSEIESGPGPLVQPGSPEMPAAGGRPRRLQLLGEIARGGMGAILKGRDPDLGRDLAVKVLLESHKEKPELIRRFIEEAQIGGQLQHPGIVPIYELGAFADRRPYFAMKLVKGRTLATLLGERGRVSAPSARPGTPGADATGLAEDSRGGERGRVSAPSARPGTPGADATGLASDPPPGERGRVAPRVHAQGLPALTRPGSPKIRAGERGRVSAPSARPGTPGADATGLAEDSRRRAGSRQRPSACPGTPCADATGLAEDSRGGERGRVTPRVHAQGLPALTRPGSPKIRGGERGRVSAPSARPGTPGADATGLASDPPPGERGRAQRPECMPRDSRR